MTGPYASAASEYLAAGLNPIPLPFKRKEYPPKGYTGSQGVDVTAADVARWSKGERNIALRLPTDLIGIDVDAYGGKVGGTTFAEACVRLGALPETVVSTSRPDDIESGIRLFRVPGGKRWKSELGDDVEVIQHGHRYMVVAPSIHPEGREYALVGSLERIAELPEAWIAELLAPERAEKVADASVLRTGSIHPQAARLRDAQLEVLVGLDLAGWFPGAKWDGKSFAVACELHRLVNANWTGYTLEEAEADFMRCAPRDDKWDARSAKWRSADKAVAGDALAEVVDFEAVEVVETTRKPLILQNPVHGQTYKSAQRLAMELNVPSPSAPVAVPRVRWWHDEWVRWDDTAWRRWDPYEMRRWLYQHLDRAVYKSKGLLSPWGPNQKRVNEMLDAIRAVLLLEETWEQPSWLDGDGGPGWLACSNGLVSLVDRVVRPHDPQFFNGFAVPFAYESFAARPQEWLRFIKQVLPDMDQRLLLQQWFGYSLTGRIDLEKFLLIVGPPRCGKGTVARVLTELLGSVNVTGTSLQNLGGPFGLQPLLGKRMAVVGDARLGDRANLAALERLLSVSGRDVVEINRKNKGAVQMVLPLLFTVMSNEVPHFDDSSGAIMSRVEILHMTESFVGREDFSLKDRLLSELPGILNWALDGIGLLGDGLASPRSGRGIAEEMLAMASPIKTWLADTCELVALEWTETDKLFESYQVWCSMANMQPGAKNAFVRKLRAAAPNINFSRRGADPQLRGYEGIRFGSGVVI